jgi:hypothetical protein
MALIKMCYISQAIKAAQTGAPVQNTEKKTPDPNSLKPSPGNAVPIEYPNGNHSAQQANPPSASNASELNKEQLSALADDVRSGAKKAQKISLRLEDFENAVAVEDAELAGRESKLSLENARNAWLQYAERQESPSLRQAMQQAALQLREHTLVATIGLSVHRGMIQEELHPLLDYLRTELQDAAVKLLVEMDETKADQVHTGTEPQRPLTVREKFEKMREINPFITDLIQRFDLKPDE